jgi:hypothetical protein
MQNTKTEREFLKRLLVKLPLEQQRIVQSMFQSLFDYIEQNKITKPARKHRACAKSRM